MPTRHACLWLLAVAAGLTGCRSLVLFWPEPTKTIRAEYPYLANKKVCVVVRGPDELLFEYPNVQWEVADHVRVALESNVRGVTVVDPKKVADFQRTDPAWETMDPAELGKKFGAERVLEIDLTQYTTREPESPHLYRGHISAAVRVYNPEYPNSQHAYQADVKTAFPPEGPGQYGTNDRAIRAATMDAFGQDVAVKFYDHEVTAR
jgi:hypothetical protein